MKFILRKYILGASIFMGGIVAAQSNVSTKQLPQMYENQINNNLPTSAVVAEKNLLTPRELMDININTLKSDPVLRNANWGFALYDPKTKKMITAHNEQNAYIPASTTKLLTTETAMSLLGGKFSWITQLEYSGEIDENGTLNGNLYIVGSGDPSLGTGKAGASTYGTIISDFISRLNEGRGIKKVNGDIIIQNAFFKINKGSQLPENIVWMEHNNYYLPVGTTKDIDPRQEKLITKSNSPFNDDKKYFYVSPYVKKMVFADQFAGNPFTTDLPDAPYYLANTMRTTMIKKGIPVTGKVVSKTMDQNPESRKVITAYKSPSLSEIVYDTNQRSDNALAEALLRMVGFQKKGDQTLESGKSVVVEHLGQAGFDLAGLSYYDGSGLSRSNKVTPVSQVKFLTSLMESPYYKEYFASLPIGGQTGTLKKMFYGSGNGKVFAKTGTLNGVKTLAGYLRTDSGKTLVFSILINNYSGSVSQVKNKIEEILEPAFDL